MIEWTDERISKLDKKQLENLLENATKRGNVAIAELCEKEIASRVTPRRTAAAAPASRNEPVSGFHFVCDDEKGVVRNSDGTIWSGTWVVDKKHAERGVTIGGYLALHRIKGEPSYLQGLVKEWREAPRERRYGDQDTKITSGVDFLVELTSEPYEWVGDGAGEKGYARGVLKSEYPQA